MSFVHFAAFVHLERGQRRGHRPGLAGAERADRLVPVERRRPSTSLGTNRADRARGRDVGVGGQGRAGFEQAVEAAENGEAEVVVDVALFADQHAVAVIIFDAAFDRAGEQRIGEAVAGDAERGLPHAGEQRVAAAVGVSSVRALADREAGVEHDAGFGERFAELRHERAGPAIVARARVRGEERSPRASAHGGRRGVSRGGGSRRHGVGAVLIDTGSPESPKVTYLVACRKAKS